MNYPIDKIVIIQRYFRKYIHQRYIPIAKSCNQTKEWRKKQEWYNNGKSNECEKYQIKLLEKIIGRELDKTNERINIETHVMSDKRNPMINADGFEFTENFDGKIKRNNKIVRFNLKMVCDNGGAQTRTLREVYHFIQCQLEYILQNNSTNEYFVNVLDGGTSHKNMDKFMYLLNKNRYINIVKYLFIGDLHDFQIKSNFFI
jgi:hypothetical protein